MILSIQSHVIHGFVGNRASLPLYQALNIATNHLDTVRLAAHPGHGTTARDILDGTVMQSLFDDYLTLEHASIPQAIHVGYFGALDQIAPTASFIQRLKAKHPEMICLLDPVFGDHGKAYIRDEIITAIMTQLLPLADIITPNQFELARLSDRAITDKTDAKHALISLAKSAFAPNRAHSSHIPKLIVATGIQDGEMITDMMVDKDQICEQNAPLKASGVSGSGDAFASIFLGHIIKKYPPMHALAQASAITHHMIQNSTSPLTLNIASGLAKIDNRAVM